MTTADTFNPNFRVLPPKEAAPVSEVPADAPDDVTPPRYRTVTRGAILAAYPHLGYLADPSQPVREATEYEAAIYTARRSDPDWAWLWRLLAEGDAFAAGKPLPLEPAPAPVAETEPEPAPDVAKVNELTQPMGGEDVPQEPAEAPEPALDETRVIEPADEHTALLPPQEAPTAMLPAATGQEADHV